MLTINELKILQVADNNASLPGIATQTGNLLPDSAMTQLAGLPTGNSNAYYYDAATNIVYVKGAGVVLNGVNFGSATVQIMANNVTIENCTFLQTSGYASITQIGPTGAIIQNCTFDSQQNPDLKLAAFIHSISSSILIQNNSFLNAPSDAVDVTGGTITGNFFSGEGYDAAHPDAIWVTDSQGPTVISNNFIDWTPNANSTSPPNDCIRITDERGPASNVTVTGNYLIGGSSGIDAGDGGGTDYSNINISGNYIGFGVNFAFAPGPEFGVTATNNVVVDFTNPAYSTAAWAAYDNSGVFTDGLTTSTAATPNIAASKTQTTTLYGGGVSGAHLFGSSQETIFVGGAGAQYMFGGSGKNIFSYLSIGDSTVHADDLISSFNTAQDVIDLSRINANFDGPQANFKFIGNAPFSSAGGEVCTVQDVADNETLVEADLVGDSSADLLIRLSGIVNLTAANFALTASQFLGDTAANTSVMTFKSSQTLLDQVAGGYSIVDTAADVQSSLAALVADALNIDAVTITDNAFATSIATFFGDSALINKFVGGVGLVDSAADVQSNLDGLQNDVGHITSINIGGSASAPATLSLTSAQVAADAAILAKINRPHVVEATGANGALTDTGYGNGLTIAVGAGNRTVTAGGTGDTLIFAPNFVASLTDFSLYANNATLHDTISLSKTEFSSWAAMVGTAKSSGNGANTTFTAQDGASLTLVGVNLYAIQHAGAQFQADFNFR